MGPGELASRLVVGPTCNAEAAASRVPTQAGYYSIFIDSANSLPAPFSDLIRARDTHLIYLGIAEKSLFGRLVKQDLHQLKGASTFFRGIGALLGYRPPLGSLVGKRNQNNYRFDIEERDAIIQWIYAHLSVAWVAQEPALREFEAAIIRLHAPIVNKTHNPHFVPELMALRAECRRIALTPRP